MTFHDAAARPVLALPGFRLDLTTDDVPVRAIRAAIGEHIEKLLVFLDLIDGDPDLEDNGDHEPALAQVGQRWHGSDDDRELDLDLTEGDGNADYEPSLGFPEGVQFAGSLAAGRGHFEEEDSAPETAGRGFFRVGARA